MYKPPKKKKSRSGTSRCAEELDKAIKIQDKSYYFGNSCYDKWLNKFSSICTPSGKTYTLEFDEENISSCLLGQGGNGFVLKYSCANDKYAIKFFTNKNNRDDEVTNLQTINDLFSNGLSSNFRVTKFIEEGDKSLVLFNWTCQLYYIIMDLADGTIKTLMCNHFKNHAANLEKSPLLAQIKHLSETIEVLHNADFAHRDIKPENILLKGDYPVLADFGLTSKCTSQIVRKKGPKYWPNPEFIQACDDKEQNLDLKSDIFNLGCLFFYFFTGKYPIGKIDLESELANIDCDLKTIILNMITYDKESRTNTIREFINVITKQIESSTLVSIQG